MFAYPISEPTLMIRQPLSSRHTLCTLSTNQPGQPQSDQDDESGGGVDPERLDLRKDQDVLDQRQQDDAGEGSNHASPTALKGDPSNDGCRKDGEDEIIALAGGDCHHLPRRHQASERGQEAGDDEDADADPVYRDTRSPCCFRVATNGVDGSSDAVIPQEEG